MLKRWRQIIVIIAALAGAVVIALGETIPSPGREIAAGAAAFVGFLGILPFFVGNDGVKRTDSLRIQLIEIMRKVWIEGDDERPGVLEDMLRDAQFDIDLATVPDKAGRALSGMRAGRIETKIVIQRGDGQPPLPIDNTPGALAKAFYDNDNQLLILGAPGSGKSVLLLQLAQRLLDDAEQNKLKAVPAIINLSTWAIKRAAIADWIVEELGRGVYGVSRKLAQEWIKGHRFVYLLDGLDEVAEAHRAECLTALNAFITPERQVAVCSRSEEYAALAGQLNVRNAVEVQPFAEDQFEGYLRQYIPHTPTVNALINVLKHDAEVWMEVQKPLFANILINTYRDGRMFSGDTGDGDVLTRLRQLVIEPYVIRQLQNVPQTKHSYSNDRTHQYLSWLGWQMQYRAITTFYVEGLQEDWIQSKLSYKLQKYFNSIINIIASAIFITAIVSSISRGWYQSNIWIASGILMYPAFLGLLRLIDISSWLMEKPRKVSRIHLIKGLYESRPTAEIMASTFACYIMMLYLFVLFVAIFASIVRNSQLGLYLIVSFVLTTIIYFWLSFNFVEIRSVSYYANNGLIKSIKYPIIIGAFFGVVGGIFDVPTGIVIGTLFAWDDGLSSTFRHLILRYLLYREGSAPLRFDHLLYHARDRRLMRQVGGGFIFLHRYVLEYFAAEWEKGRQAGR